MVVLLLPVLAEAQGRKGKKGKRNVNSEMPAPPKESAYDNLFKDKARETVKGLMTLHKTDGRVYFEIPLDLLGREMLIGSTITETTSHYFGSVGEKPHEPLHVVFTRTDSLINLREANALHATSNEQMRKNVEKNALPAVLKNFEIKAWSPDSTAVVIDMTDFLADGNTEALDPFSPWMPILWQYGGGEEAQLEKEFKQEYTQLGRVAAYENNVSVQTSLTYDVSVQAQQWYWIYKMPFTALMTRTFLLLPETPMRTRLARPAYRDLFRGQVSLRGGRERCRRALPYPPLAAGTQGYGSIPSRTAHRAGTTHRLLRGQRFP